MRPTESLFKQVYNVAVGDLTTLNELLCSAAPPHLLPHYSHLQGVRPVHRDFRSGDVRHSLADIGTAERLLGYASTRVLENGWSLPCCGICETETYELNALSGELHCFCPWQE